MSDGGMFADEAEPNNVDPIKQPNAMEEAAQRYWRASLMWHERIETNWTYGEMIAECCDLRRYRGCVSLLVEGLIDAVVHYDEPAVVTPITQEVGQ